jgi:MFS family permease
MLDIHVAALAWSTASASFGIGSLLATPFVRLSAEKFGRRNTVGMSTCFMYQLQVMILHNLVILTASLVLFVAYHANLYELFIVGRLLTGASRCFSWFTPIFLTEVSPHEHRGTTALLTGVR